jgi:hypothetical protein
MFDYEIPYNRTINDFIQMMFNVRYLNSVISQVAQKITTTMWVLITTFNYFNANPTKKIDTLASTYAEVKQSINFSIHENDPQKIKLKSDLMNALDIIVKFNNNPKAKSFISLSLASDDTICTYDLSIQVQLHSYIFDVICRQFITPMNSTGAIPWFDSSLINIKNVSWTNDIKPTLSHIADMLHQDSSLIDLISYICDPISLKNKITEYISQLSSDTPNCIKKYSGAINLSSEPAESKQYDYFMNKSTSNQNLDGPERFH